MKKILAMILVPFLSMYFVTIDTYEQDMAELKNRIEILEEQSQTQAPVDKEHTWEKGKYTVVTSYRLEEESVHLYWHEFCNTDSGECETQYRKTDLSMSEDEFIKTLESELLTWYRVVEEQWGIRE